MASCWYKVHKVYKGMAKPVRPKLYVATSPRPRTMLVVWGGAQVEQGHVRASIYSNCALVVHACTNKVVQPDAEKIGTKCERTFTSVPKH